MRRRDFVLTGVAGLVGLPSARANAQGRQLVASPGLQLYTLRTLAQKNLAGTLAAAAKAGYREIEFAGYHGHPSSVVRRMLDDNGLVSPSAHISMDQLGPIFEVAIEDALTLGQKYLTCSWIDAKYRTADGYKSVAAMFNDAGLMARGDKVHFAFHNNAYEFARLAGGECGMDILIRECPAENLAIEADVFWMRTAGQNPLDWFARYPGRFHMLHLKDMGPPPRKAMVDVGAGTINWKRLLTAAKKAGAIHFFVEHDEPADPMASIRNSHKYLRTLRA